MAAEETKKKKEGKGLCSPAELEILSPIKHVPLWTVFDQLVWEDELALVTPIVVGGIRCIGCADAPSFADRGSRIHNGIWAPVFGPLNWRVTPEAWAACDYVQFQRAIDPLGYARRGAFPEGRFGEYFTVYFYDEVPIIPFDLIEMIRQRWPNVERIEYTMARPIGDYPEVLDYDMDNRIWTTFAR